MNKKVYKMYEAPKMEIVEVELRDGMMLNTSGNDPDNPVEGRDPDDIIEL